MCLVSILPMHMVTDLRFSFVKAIMFLVPHAFCTQHIYRPRISSPTCATRPDVSDGAHSQPNPMCLIYIPPMHIVTDQPDPMCLMSITPMHMVTDLRLSYVKAIICLSPTDSAPETPHLSPIDSVPAYHGFADTDCPSHNTRNQIRCV